MREAYKKKIQSLANVLCNLIAVSQIAQNHFDDRKKESNPRDEGFGQSIRNQIRQELSEIFLDQDRNNKYTLVKPSDHLYTVYHQNDIPHVFEKNLYPSVIWTAVKETIPQFLKDTISQIAYRFDPPTVDPSQNQFTEEENEEEFDLMDVDEEEYNPTTNSSDSSEST